MDLNTALAVVAVALALATVVIAVALSRRPRAVADVALPTAMELLRGSIEDMRAANASAMNDLRAEMQRTLGATEQQLTTQTGATQRALSDLSRQLGTLSEQSQRIGDLAKDIGSLQDLLRAPKARGGFGELLLERLLHDALPASAYEIQYTYKDGSRVDAIVRYAGRIVPIDAKFPNETWNALAKAADETERRVKKRAFLQQVRRHIDAVGRYVSPA